MKKLVSESLNELYKFEKKGNALDSLNIGKKSLIISWLDKMNVTDYIINDDLTIDCKFSLFFRIDLVKFPEYIQFNFMHQSFWCNDCNLVTLRGCPRIVKGNFDCSDNFLDSLEGCPEEVDGHFYCVFNKIKKFTIEDVKKVCRVKGVIQV